MNIYSVYFDSSKKKNNLLFIRQGFSFTAGIFNFFWAMYHKMWFIVFLMVIISAAISNSATSYIVYSVKVAIVFIFCFFASELREYYAKKRGFALSDIVVANSEEDAELKYYMRSTSN